MNKTLIALAAAFLAVTALFGSGAEAGFNVRLGAPAGFSTVHKAGCGGGHRFHRRRHHRSVRRHVKRKVHVAKQQSAKPVTVAKVEDEPETTDKVAEMENSSIATASGKVAEAKTAEPEKKVAAAKNVGCKQFFPAVGMTLSVRCD